MYSQANVRQLCEICYFLHVQIQSETTVISSRTVSVAVYSLKSQLMTGVEINVLILVCNLIKICLTAIGLVCLSWTCSSVEHASFNIMFACLASRHAANPTINRLQSIGYYFLLWRFGDRSTASRYRQLSVGKCSVNADAFSQFADSRLQPRLKSWKTKFLRRPCSPSCLTSFPDSQQKRKLIFELLNKNGSQGKLHYGHSFRTKFIPGNLGIHRKLVTSLELGRLTRK